MSEKSAVPGYSLTWQQQEAIERFSRLKVGALFMEMGTGKTLTALTLAAYNHPDKVIFLGPKSTLKNLEREIEKWGVLECPYKTFGYESIAASDRIFQEALDWVRDSGKVFCIADESIFLKSGRAKRLKRATEIRHYCEWALILNGTPIVKDEWDLYNQMNFLSPQIIQMNAFDFIAKFFVEHRIRDRWRLGKGERVYYTFYEPNRPALTKIIEPYVFQAKLEFEHKEKEEYIWVSPSSSEIYDHHEALDRISIEYAGDRDAMMMRLITQAEYDAGTCHTKNKRVAEYIKGKRLICFCQYREEIDDISGMVDCYVITGDTHTDKRDSILQAFEHDAEPKPLVMTLGVGSYSLNLQFCDEIVYSSITYNYGKMEQSKFRIKRTGQEKDIRYTYILTRFGICDQMLDNLGKKESLSTIISRLLTKKDVKDFIEKL